MKQRESGLPFDDFRNLIAGLPPGNEDLVSHTIGQFDETLRSDSNKIATLCAWYSRWSGRSPVVHRPLLTLFAGTHRIADRLDGGADSARVLDSVTAVAEGRAVVNRLCQQHDLGLKLFDLALQLPVADISMEPALDEKSCAGTIAFGMEAIAGGSDLLSISAISPEATCSALAILSTLHRFDFEHVVRTFGLSPDAVTGIQAARENIRGHEDNPMEVLRRLGGRETAAICGAILSARTERVPVIVGGITGLAACAVLYAQNCDAIAHCVFASRTGLSMMDDLVTQMGVQFVLDQSLSPVFGADAIIASSIVQSACKHLSAEDQATRE